MILLRSLIKITVTLVLPLFIYSCGQKSDIQVSKPLIVQPRFDTSITLLKKKIISGDSMAYYQLRKIYMDSDLSAEFLVWAMLMANKFQFQVAYYDVFFCLHEINSINGVYNKRTGKFENYLDTNSIRISFDYLSKIKDTTMISETRNYYYSK
jgi:hypothetical protein